MQHWCTFVAPLVPYSNVALSLRHLRRVCRAGAQYPCSAAGSGGRVCAVSMPHIQQHPWLAECRCVGSPPACWQLPRLRRCLHSCAVLGCTSVTWFVHHKCCPTLPAAACLDSTCAWSRAVPSHTSLCVFWACSTDCWHLLLRCCRSVI
mgnify:CR=1 FL=1